MRINKKIESEIADQFEGALDYIAALYKVPSHVKREAVEIAAKLPSAI